MYFVYKYTLGGDFNDAKFHSIQSTEDYAKEKCMELARIRESELDFSTRIATSTNTQLPRTIMNSKHHIVGRILWECAPVEKFNANVVFANGYCDARNIIDHRFARLPYGMEQTPQLFHWADYTVNQEQIDNLLMTYDYTPQIRPLLSILNETNNIYYGAMNGDYESANSIESLFNLQ